MTMSDAERQANIATEQEIVAYGGFESGIVWRQNAVGGLSNLDLRLDLRNHPATGFAWGYGGSGPAQLALALLADATGDDEVALTHYLDYKKTVVEQWTWGEDWTLEWQDILGWLDSQGVEVKKLPRPKAAWARLDFTGLFTNPDH